MKIKKNFGRLTAVLLLCTLLSAPVQAAASDTPYDGYRYNAKQEAVEAPAGYVPQKVLSGKQLPGGSFYKPADLFVDEEGFLNVLGSDTGCITVLNKELQFQKLLRFRENGQETELPGLSGIFIKGTESDKRYYAADPQNQRVIVADNNLNIIQTITRPENESIPAGVLFAPSKVLADQKGAIYVLLPGLYRGACVFSPEGEFLSFFGSNTVELSPMMLLDYFWKGLLNRKQVEGMARYVPVEYNNFDLTANNFIYTVTKNKASGGSIASVNEIKRMNAKSVNVYPAGNYGDLEVAWHDGRLADTAFEDIDVMDNGFVAAVDSSLGRVFIYDENGQWITVFGGMGVLKGLFKLPVAVETIGQHVFVLDQVSDNVTMFVPSAFGEQVFSAMALYNKGEYEDSVAVWEEVLRYSGGYDPAYISIGKTLLNSGRYKEAMEYFKLGHAPELYSDAFKMQRNNSLRSWFYPIFALLAIGVIWIVVSEARNRTSKKREKDPEKLSFRRRVMYTLFHPTEGHEAGVRCNTVKAAAILSGGILFVWFAATVLVWQYSGYVFSQNEPEDFNIWAMLAQTVLVFGLFALSNWFVSSMMDGSGRLSDIVYTVSVGLIPYICYQFLSLFLTNLLTREESAFLTLIAAVFIIWSVALIVLGLKTVHEFSFLKTIALLFYTILGIVIILFLALLMWSLFQQMGLFVSTLIDEISLKMK